MDTQPATLIHGLPPPGAPARHANQQLVFDFTKRKRWADLLVTELTEAIMLVLSDTGVVWYCGPAVEDLLGWADEDLVDGTLFEIMNENDREAFERQFKDAIQERTDLLSYVRLRCKSENDRYGPNIPIIPSAGSTAHVDGTHGHPQRISTTASAKEVLFEIKGYAHYVVSSTLSATLGGFDIRDLHGLSSMNGRAGPPGGVRQDGIFKCFFAVAKPYPSRNTAMLNTFLELKIENERLHQRLRDAKAREAELDRLEAKNQGLPAFTLTQPPPYAGSSSGAGGVHARANTAPSTQSFAWTLGSAAAGSSRSFDGRPAYAGLADVSAVGAAGGGIDSPGGSGTPGEPTDPSADHTVPRKKSKKTFAPEMHCCMTCGRTESPEWRKGPQGPKTLCNACGLRWAKSSRKDSNQPEGEGATSGA